MPPPSKATPMRQESHDEATLWESFSYYWPRCGWSLAKIGVTVQEADQLWGTNTPITELGIFHWSIVLYTEDFQGEWLSPGCLWGFYNWEPRVAGWAGPALVHTIYGCHRCRTRERAPVAHSHSLTGAWDGCQELWYCGLLWQADEGHAQCGREWCSTQLTVSAVGHHGDITWASWCLHHRLLDCLFNVLFWLATKPLKWSHYCRFVWKIIWAPLASYYQVVASWGELQYGLALAHTRENREHVSY